MVVKRFFARSNLQAAHKTDQVRSHSTLPQASVEDLDILYRYPGLLYSNLQISPDKAYILYIGDPKYINTTSFLIGTLSEKYSRPVEIINILPNLPPPHLEGNIVVINDILSERILKHKQQKLHLPLDQPEINLDVSKNQYVGELIDLILESQSDLYVNLFKSTPEMTLHTDPRVKVIGPDGELYEYFDNKINQRAIVDELDIPRPRSFVAETISEVVELYEREFQGDAFITCSNGFGGNGTARVRNTEEILSCEKFKDKSGYIISEYLNLVASPCSLALVANEHEVIVASIADQIMDGPDYVGTVYPSNTGEEKIAEMAEYTIRIGKYLGKHLYRGFFGVDFMIDDRDLLYFVEINPRKIGSTLETMYAHHAHSPEAVSLAELELRAVTSSTFGISTSEYEFPKIQWGVTGIKAKQGQRTVDYVVPQELEENVFLNSGVTVLDHPGEDVTYLESGRLARVICVFNDNSSNYREEIIKQLNREVRKAEVGK